MIDINKILYNNRNKIRRIALKYHYNYDVDDFYQELLIESWKFLSSSYDPSRSNNPEAFLVIYLNTLAKRVLKRFNADKSIKLNDGMEQLNEGLSSSVQPATADIDDVIDTLLTDTEKKIVYSIDAYDNKKKVFYSDLAKILGMSPQTLSYHIKSIRKKLKSVKIG